MTAAPDGRVEARQTPTAVSRPPRRRGRWMFLPAYALVAVLAVALYLPFILDGGFIMDDWGYLKNAQDFPRFWDSVRHYFPLMWHRPLVPLVMTAETALLGQRPWPYILVNLLLWLGFVILLCRTLARRFGHFFGVVAAALGVAPVLSSAVVFWPLAMTGGTLSCLLWAISFALLARQLDRGRYSLWPYVPLLGCMALYEAVLPLFALTVLFPFLHPSVERQPRFSFPRQAAKYVIPPAVIALLPALSQRLLLPWLLPQMGYGDDVVTRLSLTWPGAALGGTSWAFALTGGQILLWAHGLWEALDDWTVALQLLPAAAAGLGAMALAARADRRARRRPPAMPRRALVVLLICLLAGSLVFVLSGQLAYFSGGCGNRIMLATWIGQAMVLAFLAANLKTPFARAAVAVILVASVAGLIVQEQNCIRSWHLQGQVRAAFTTAVQEQDMTGGATVVADVPRVVGGSCFYATVFQTPWDWGAMVAMPRGAPGDQGAVVGANQPAGLEVTREGTRIAIRDWWKADLGEVWFFCYDERSCRGMLRPVSDAEDWDWIIGEVERRNLNPRPEVIEERVAYRLFGRLGQ